MLKNNKNEKSEFFETISLFKERPIIIAPLIICWALYLGVIFCFKHYFDWSDSTGEMRFLIIVGFYFAFSIAYGLSCLILLEIIQQIKKGDRINIFKAIFDVIFRDLLKSLIVIITWGICWVVLMFMDLLVSGFRRWFPKSYYKQDGESEAVEFMLGSKEQSKSPFVFFADLAKGVRLVSFLILPAVAWEDLSLAKAVKRGFEILAKQKLEFIKTYKITSVFFFVFVMLPGLSILISGRFDFSGAFLYGLLIYMLFVSSFLFLVEQLGVSKLYYNCLVQEGKKSEVFPKGFDSED